MVAVFFISAVGSCNRHNFATCLVLGVSHGPQMAVRPVTKAARAGHMWPLVRGIQTRSCVLFPLSLILQQTQCAWLLRQLTIPRVVPTFKNWKFLLDSGAGKQARYWTWAWNIARNNKNNCSWQKKMYISPLRPSGNYMNHLLWQSVMLHFVFISFVWFSL
jgi:hypothetical protein